MRSRLPAQVREFDTFWSGDGIETVHLEEFCARFLEDQKAIIQRELDSAPIHDDARAREEAHINFAKERARNFQGRTEVLEQVERHLTGSIITNSPLIIHGEGGAGKSAVIAQTFQNACADAHCGEVIARFIGGASGADNLYDLLTNLVADIARKFGHSRPPIAETIIDAREHFAWALSLSSAERPLLLFLDGIDQLNDKKAELLLKWLPEPLRHTKLVISCRSEKKLISAAIRLGMNTLELGALSPEDGKQLLDAWLIRSNKHILSGHPTIGSWPKYRVMLQLALEEDPESGIFKSARRWLSSGAVEWDVIVAPAKTPKNTSLRIRAGVRHDESIQVCLDEDNNIVVMDESGLCQSYHGSDGSPLGACDMPAEFIARAELSETPPRGMELINAWPIGDGRWFGWNGLVWHFNPTADRWEELPRGHHHQVWFATGLPSGGFASLGVYANVGTLAVWCDEGTKPEIISIPHYPRHHLDGNAPQLTGIVEISDGRYLIWPFMDDGSAA